MLDRIARVLCPEAFDRDAFRRIVKKKHGGHTTGINVAASMQQAQDAAYKKARNILNAIRIPTMDMGLAGATEVIKQMLGPGSPADYDAAMDAFTAMVDEALKAPVSGKDTMIKAGSRVGKTHHNRLVPTGPVSPIGRCTRPPENRDG